MQGATLAIAILGAILVLSLRIDRALAAYFAILVWYPDYLRISIGTLDISAGRIIVLVLLARCLFNGRLRSKLVWSRLDTWVALSMVVYVVVYCLTRPGMESVENRGGFLMDTWLAYLAARFCITNRTALITFAKSIAVILAPLAVLGIFEAVTHMHPFAYMRQYCPWRAEVKMLELRWGLARAYGPFSHPIMFGSCFVMFLPLIWALRRERGSWRQFAVGLSVITVLGGLSCVSSGPWGMLMVVIFCMGLERYKHRLKGVLVGFVILCVAIEIVSNRPFYRLLYQYGNFGKGSWYQRAKLIDSAIETFDEWWMAGYYGKDPGWGAASGMAFTDCNNEFLLKGIRYGMLGVIALCGTLALAFHGLVRAFKETTDKGLRSLYWAMGSSLVGIIVIWQAVSFFGQSTPLFYCLLGTIGSSFGLAQYAAAQTKPVPTVSKGDLMSMYGQV